MGRYAGRMGAGLIVALVIGIAAALGLFGSAHAQTVRVEGGALSGASDGDVLSYKGVAYAAPPTGPLRWAPPQPVQRWSGVREARTFGPACPQTPLPPQRLTLSGGDSGPQSEDCLYLNVWTPKGARGAPVMVWLHGGGLTLGSGSIPWYDGTAFARDGVVLVTINYRLGALGWFAHPALTRAARASGQAFANYGLMDQIAALKWVQRNIAAFGGDPKRVTVFGESAGGASVQMLLTSPAASGLFAQAIIESGGTGEARPLGQAETMGATALGAGLSVSELRALPLETVNTAATAQAAGAVVDGRLLPEAPARALREGRARDVPLIVGSNSGEDSLLTTAEGEAGVLASIPPERKAQVLAAYGVQAPDKALAHALFTDLVMGAPAKAIARETASGQPAWLYHFDYVPEALRAMFPRAPHGVELFFVFKTLDRGPMKVALTAADLAMADKVHGCWVAFAKTGRPDCPGGPAWPAYDPRSDTLLDFGPTPRLVSGFRRAPYAAIEGLTWKR